MYVLYVVILCYVIVINLRFIRPKNTSIYFVDLVDIIDEGKLFADIIIFAKIQQIRNKPNFMKKSLLSVVLFMLVVFGANAQYFQVDTAKLNTAYRALVNEPDKKENQLLFFDTFPCNWREFITTYGLCSKDGYDLTMYDAAHCHIEALGSISLVNDTVYCRKLVNIAVGGTYEADAPNFFKSLLHRVMHEKMDAMLYTVSQLRKGHCMQFWQFYWSSNRKSDELEKEFALLHELNIGKYPDMMKTMEIAFHYFYNGVNIDGGYLKGSGIAYDNNGQYVFPVLETQAEFPGGYNAFLEWIGNNLQYPMECAEQGIEGRAFVSFVIKKDGSIDNVELLKSSGNTLLDQEALRLINDEDMPQWIPATQFGEAEGEFIKVDSRFVMPVVFKLKRP